MLCVEQAGDAATMSTLAKCRALDPAPGPRQGGLVHIPCLEVQGSYNRAIIVGISHL